MPDCYTVGQFADEIRDVYGEFKDATSDAVEGATKNTVGQLTDEASDVYREGGNILLFCQKHN